MPVTSELRQGCSLIRLEGEFTVNSAAEIKRLLLEALGRGSEVHLDLVQVEEIDLSLMQLLFAAGREAERNGTRVEFSLSAEAAAATRHAGFERFPGLAVRK